MTARLCHPFQREIIITQRKTDVEIKIQSGRKEYRGVREDGTAWEKIVKWFGYKLHLIVDSNYELPIAYSVIKASELDFNEAHRIINTLSKDHPEILESCEALGG